MPEFTNDWFVRNIPMWEAALSNLAEKKIDFLELGCYEGQASVWIAEHLLKHPESTLTCIDIWSNGSEELKSVDWEMVQHRFLSNIEPWKEKITIHQGDSVRFLYESVPLFRRYDAIYIDADHTAMATLMNAVLAHRVLRANGVLIFDDYFWNGLVHHPHTPKPAIDAFMECFAEHYDVVSIGYQVILKKKIL